MQLFHANKIQKKIAIAVKEKLKENMDSFGYQIQQVKRKQEFLRCTHFFALFKRCF